METELKLSFKNTESLMDFASSDLFSEISVISGPRRSCTGMVLSGRGSLKAKSLISKAPSNTAAVHLQDFTGVLNGMPGLTVISQ